MTAFEQVRQLITEAEQRHKRKNLQANFEKAQQVYTTARANFEKAQENLKLTKIRHGNFEQIHDQKLKELIALRDASARLKDELETEGGLEQLFKQAKDEIDVQCISARQEIQALEEKLKVAQEELRKALEPYKQLKQEYEAFAGAQQAQAGNGVEKPEAAAIVDGLATRADLESLRENINAANALFGEWPSEEQHAMLGVWAAKARLLQDMGHWSDEEDGIIRGIFGKLNSLSQTYRPGFIDALNRNFSTDWVAYGQQNNDKYQLLVSTRKQREQQEAERKARELEQRRILEDARQRLAPDLNRLKEIAAKSPDASLHPELRELVQRLLQALNGRLDEDEIELLLPHRDAFKENSDFRWLRKQFERLDKAQDPAELAKIFPKAFENLRGKRVVMIGGSPREDTRKDLAEFFRMSELNWESCQGNEPQVLARVENRIKNKGLDVVIELTSFVGHHVETLRPVCEQNDCKFARVQKGYGRAQIAQAMQGAGYRTN